MFGNFDNLDEKLDKYKDAWEKWCNSISFVFEISLYFISQSLNNIMINKIKISKGGK